MVQFLKIYVYLSWYFEIKTGVGLAAVQIAKALGASVIIGTVGSDDKAEVVRAAGATHVLNYNTEKQWAQRVLKITDQRGVGMSFEDTKFDSCDKFDDSL